MSKKIKLLKAGVVAATLLALQGCVYLWVSKGMTDDGHVTELVFPNIQTKATLKEGIFINRANLRQMAPDMSKEQVYNLLGRPHFEEGMGVAVREWDYIFNFRNETGPGYITCQYKVLFDKNLKAQNFHWLPESCADKANSPGK